MPGGPLAALQSPARRGSRGQRALGTERQGRPVPRGPRARSAWYSRQVRAHPDAEFREAFAVILLKDDGDERYLIMPDIAAAISTEIVTEMFYTTINRQRVVSLWPVRLPASDGRINEWHRSAQEAAEHAMGRWIRVVSNRNLGAYEIVEASAQIPDPEWPKYTFHELLKIGFRDRIISSFDHPVLKRLRGEC